MGYWKPVLIFSLALAALVLGFRYGMRAVTESSRRAAPPPEPAEWASWKEERFDDLGFSLRHPADSPVIAGQDQTYRVEDLLAVDATTRFTVKIPKTRYKGTSFLDAFVSVAAGGDIPASDGQRKALCNLLSRGERGTRPLAGSADIAGTTFATGGTSDAAGNVRAETVAYHAWFRGHCIELTENLFSVIGGRAKDFDRVDAWKQLDGIVRTFRPVGAGK